MTVGDAVVLYGSLWRQSSWPVRAESAANVPSYDVA